MSSDQEGGSRDVRLSSDASRDCHLAAPETHCGRPQDGGFGRVLRALFTSGRRDQPGGGGHDHVIWRDIDRFTTEDPCQAEEKESFLTPFLPRGTDLLNSAARRPGR